ncbi:class I SAM-dependent methyltransferase [Aquitalea sp. LB_tupeE]|uniref:class I SAM-dependent methyltransferase n=1 Tax=Aquitalea sp. LB_tupeE TaxID=2748078 RepID=UPI0015C09234|nr:class I SAM-dependent methyltransferase [Aquitalea sp. LB_tupeE]NWK78683.1 methyltransferase domain-containing protein [Aquitalea sp. LB_tupeE]
MSAPAMLVHLLLEQLARHPLPRIPETAAVMEDPLQVAAFADSGKDQGILNYIYLFHSLMSAALIAPGDVVLDLACGPANQLLRHARLHPDAHFIGMDASARMLELAEQNLREAGVHNVSLQQGDMTRLDGMAAAGTDVVTCTMSLHHLADSTALQHCTQQIARILRPQGGVYLADFGRLKRRATQRFFAYDRMDLQSPAFTADFLNSLQAAFSLTELQQAAAVLASAPACYYTALAPFMVVLRSTPRRAIDPGLQQRAQAAYQQLIPGEQRDLCNLLRWFRPGGLRLPDGLMLTGG